MRLRRDARVPVVKTADNRNGTQFRRTGGGRGRLMRHWRVTIQTLMRPGHVVILLDVFPQYPVQMRLAEHDHVIE